MLKQKRKVSLPEIMLFVIAAFVPVIVRTGRVNIPPEFINIFPAGVVIDVFSFHKAWLLCVTALVIVIYYLSDLILKPYDRTSIKTHMRKLIRDPVVIFAAIYIFFVILSNILSPYTHTALWGAWDRREGLFVQLAYIVVFFTTMFIIKDAVNVRFILIGLMISSLIMGSIGFSQFINRDFFATQLAAWIVIGPGAEPMSPMFTISYGTNFNPNTFGLVTAMLTPLMFTAAISVSFLNTNRLCQTGFTLAGILMLTGVIGSSSVGGLIGVSTAFAVVVLTVTIKYFINKERFKVPKRILPVCAAVISVVLLFGILLRAHIRENLFFTMDRIAAIFHPPDMTHLPDFDFNSDTMTITVNNISYDIRLPSFEEQDPVVSIAGIAIEPSVEHTEPEDILRYTFYIPGVGQSFIYRLWDNVFVYREIVFYVEYGRILIYYIRDDVMIDPREPIPSFGFEGWETWGSSRGHIFARTLPLLPQSIVIGKGSDTFALQFPSHDVISNLRYHGHPYILVDKAHNLYLQTAVTTGVVSALALIAIFAYFIVISFVSLVRRPFRVNEKIDDAFILRLGILASVSAFSVSSLSTDSTVSSTPIFWIIIGIGLALNKMIEVNQK